MSFGGFGKNSGPNTQPGAQTPFGNSPRHPVPSSPLPVSPRPSIDYGDLDTSVGISSQPLISTRPFPGTQKSNEPPLRWGYVKTSSLKDPGAQYQRPPTGLQQVDSRHLRTVSPAKTAEVQSFRRTNSSYSQSPHEIPNTSRSPMYSDRRYMDPYGARSSPPVFHNNQYVGGQRPQFQEAQQRPFSPVWVNQSKLSSHNSTPPVQERISPVLATGVTLQSGPVFQTELVDGSLQKRTRSPTLPTATGFSPENARFDGHQRSVVDYRDLDAPEAMSVPPMAFESSSSRREPSRPFGGTPKLFYWTFTWRRSTALG